VAMSSVPATAGKRRFGVTFGQRQLHLGNPGSGVLDHRPVEPAGSGVGSEPVRGERC
jgi:hypothetical protein